MEIHPLGRLGEDSLSHPVRTRGGRRTLKGHWDTPHEGKGPITKASSQNGGMRGEMRWIWMGFRWALSPRTLGGVQA